jgi:hypothetical protein
MKGEKGATGMTDGQRMWRKSERLMGIFRRTRADENNNAATRNAKRKKKKSETPKQYADANARSRHPTTMLDASM